MSINSKHIYIIDDNEAVCNALEFSIECFFDDIIVNKYSNPLEFFKHFSTDGQGCCLIIDMFMPHLNGIDFIKKLNSKNNKMPIIVISGHNSSEIAEQALNEGAIAFFTKPLNLDLLIEKIAFILQKA